jgi:hypothetical protein
MREAMQENTVMYTLGDLVDYTSGSIYAREILDPNGGVICYVIEAYGNSEPALALLSHLNR